jgi:Fe-S-cluster containining protein
MTECKECGHCCTYLELPLGYDPRDPKFYTFVAPWLATRGVKLEQRGKLFWAIIQLPCPHLSPGGWCVIHERKPYVCKQGSCPKEM